MDCHVDDDKLVLKKNGKSFYWAGKLLPKESINRAAELYRFCRILDDIADSGKINSLKELSKIRSNIKQKAFAGLEKNYSIKYPKFLNISSKKIVIDLIDGLILDQKSILPRSGPDSITSSDLNQSHMRSREGQIRTDYSINIPSQSHENSGR